MECLGLCHPSQNNQEEYTNLIKLIWDTLDNKKAGQIKLCNLRAFIAAIQGIHFLTQKADCNSKYLYGEYNDSEIFMISDSQFAKIQKDFSVLNLTKKSYQPKNKTESKHANLIEHSFRPQFCKNSSKLIGFRCSRENSKTGDKMNATFSEHISKKQINTGLYFFIKNSNREIKIKEKNQAELNQCTFKPVINNYTPGGYDHDLSKGERLKFNKAKDQCEYERNKKECTFTPKVNKGIIKKRSFAQDRLTDKVIERMKKGREERGKREGSFGGGDLSFKKEKSQLPKKTSQAKKKVISRNTHAISMPMSPIIKSPKNEDSFQKKILLYIDVNMGDHEERIAVYEGESASQLVSQFAENHSIL